MSALPPRAARPFISFAASLRGNGFAVATEQTTAFLSAVALLGPSSMADIRRAAAATLAPPPERRPEFDALFDAHFLGATAVAAETTEATDDELRVGEAGRGEEPPPISDEEGDSGQAAAATERLARRRFGDGSEADALRRLERMLPERMPRRRGYRRRADRRGHAFDLRRSLREAIRHDGEVLELPRLRRRPRERRVLLLIDVSGSMKTRSDAHLRFAHTLVQTVQQAQVFTIGTRLTRVTLALRTRNRNQALAQAADAVADWDGGTRLGDALAAYLAVPRFAGYARGALVLVLSDGLERGDPRTLVQAVRRLSSLAWQVSWLTPLAADPRYRPETSALASILPLVELADGSSIAQLCAHLLDRPRAVPA